ncbi:unnamed protein product [Chilo suppressalis]|uniref:Uncharacterized protein n=1 Tax=Chilo suppressalis TaxID=168631 RepID=A0ABN8ATN2_CHISP|nr:unnamed protein product [Chilo suppressalis]
MALTAAEKQRRYREKRKLNPEKVAEAKRKDLERYHAKKRLVKDMTPREHRVSKKKWRVANAKRRDRQRALRIIMHTPESTPGVETPPPSDMISRNFSPRFVTARRLSTPQPPTPRYGSASPNISAKARGRKKVKRDRSKLLRENLKFKEELQKMKKKYEKYKKRYNRAVKKELTISNPNDSYDVLSNAIKERYKKMKSLKERRIIHNIFKEDSITKSRKKVQIIKDCLDINQGYFRKHTPKQRTNILKFKLHEFFNRDDVSRATAGKKETVTFKKSKMQKRYLLDNMKNLFYSFKRENPEQKCCYSSFTLNRPFYVKPPSVDARETCLCRLHTNISYLSAALFRNKIIPTSDLNTIIQQEVCDVDSLACMSGNCFNCQQTKLKYDTTKNDLLVSYPQWVRKTEIVEKSGKKMKVTKNIKEEVKSKVENLIDAFEETLKNFKRHVYNIKTQYKNYRACIDRLTEEEIALHVDFSENYNCKLHEEIQSHHFGSSRNQVSLHTGVLYNRSSQNQNLEVESFCTVSSNLSHGPPAIWSHLHPILTSIQDRFPKILKDSSKVKMYLITDKDIEKIAREVPAQIVPLYGTMKVHQVFTEEVGTLKYRELSCFCQRGFCSCMCPKNYSPLKDTVEESEDSNSATLADITNFIEHKRKSIYNVIYNSSSESGDNIPLTELKNRSFDQPGLSKEKKDNNDLIEKENIHPSKVKAGVYILVKICSSKNEYIYLGKALSEVDDDGEVKIVYLKSVDDTAKIFKLIENDVSYEQYESLLKIVSEPQKGKSASWQYVTLFLKVSSTHSPIFMKIDGDSTKSEVKTFMDWTNYSSKNDTHIKIWLINPMDIPNLPQQVQEVLGCKAAPLLNRRDPEVAANADATRLYLMNRDR